MWQADEDSFAEVLPAMHAGAVTGVDCAVRRPLAVTVGADHAIRLWNHADRCALMPAVKPRSEHTNPREGFAWTHVSIAHFSLHTWPCSAGWLPNTLRRTLDALWQYGQS